MDLAGAPYLREKPVDEIKIVHDHPAIKNLDLYVNG